MFFPPVFQFYRPERVNDGKPHQLTPPSPPHRRKPRNGHKLDLQLRRRPSHPPGHREPRLQILDHLGKLRTPPSIRNPTKIPPPFSLE